MLIANWRQVSESEIGRSGSSMQKYINSRNVPFAEARTALFRVCFGENKGTPVRAPALFSISAIGPRRPSCISWCRNTTRYSGRS